MQFLLDITWSPDGKHLMGTLRPMARSDESSFTGTLDLIRRIESLLDGSSEGDGSSGGHDTGPTTGS
jgi:hypothetical protein